MLAAVLAAGAGAGCGEDGRAPAAAPRGRGAAECAADLSSPDPEVRSKAGDCLDDLWIERIDRGEPRQEIRRKAIHGIERMGTAAARALPYLRAIEKDRRVADAVAKAVVAVRGEAPVDGSGNGR